METNKDVDGLIRGLTHKDARHRIDAARSLGRIGSAQSMAPLAHAMNNDKWDVAVEAACALGKMGDITGIETLIRLHAHNYYVAKGSGIFERAFGELGVAALEPLVRSLEDRDPATRKVSADSLRWLQDHRAIEPLAQALSHENNRWVGAHIGAALARLEDPRGIAFLVRDLEHASGNSGDDTYEALVEMGKPAAEPLVGVLNDFRRRDLAARILIKIGVESTEAVTNALAHQDAEVRALAAKILGLIGDPKTKGSLVLALNDRSDDVRLWASISLGFLVLQP